jgi:stearoyl-CoA desaturase (delta-9 desaturase)
MYGRKHQRGLNWVTAIAMTGFHIGAVAALFYVDYGAMLAALILYSASACPTTAC